MNSILEKRLFMSGVVIALITIGLTLRLRDLAEPGLTPNHGDSPIYLFMLGGQYHLDPGIGKTNLLFRYPTVSDVRVQHQPLYSWILAVVFAIFDTGEIQARLATILLTLIGWLVFFRIWKELNGQQFALLWLFFILTIPMAVYSDRLIQFESTDSLFFAAVLYCYYRYFSVENPKYFLLMLLFFFLGSLANWTIYFTLPPVALHYLIFSRRRDRLILPIALFGCSVLCLSFYLAYVFAVEDQLLVTLKQRLISRISVSVETFSPYSLRILYAQFIQRGVYQFTTPIMGFAFLGLVLSARDLLRRRNTQGAFWVWGLLLYGLPRILLFHNTTFHHDIWNSSLIPFFTYSPAYTIAFALKRRWVPVWDSFAKTIAVFTLAAIHLIYAYRGYQTYFAKPGSPELLTQYLNFHHLSRVATPSNRVGIFDNENWISQPDIYSGHILYLMHNKYFPIPTTADISFAQNEKSIQYLAFNAEDKTKPLVRALLKTYAPEPSNEYWYVDLSAPTIPLKPGASKNLNGLDGCNILDAKLASVDSPRPRSTVHGYLRGDQGLPMPRLRVDLWLAFDNTPANMVDLEYTVKAVYAEKMLTLVREHKILNGLVLPTDVMPGQPYRDIFEIEAPLGATPMIYQVFVKVKRQGPQNNDDLGLPLGEIRVSGDSNIQELGADALRKQNIVWNSKSGLTLLSTKVAQVSGELRLESVWQRHILYADNGSLMAVIEGPKGFRQTTPVCDSSIALWKSSKSYILPTVIPLSKSLYKGEYIIKFKVDGELSPVVATVSLGSLVPTRIIHSAGYPNHDWSDILSAQISPKPEPDKPYKLVFKPESVVQPFVAGISGQHPDAIQWTDFPSHVDVSFYLPKAEHLQIHCGSMLRMMGLNCQADFELMLPVYPYQIYLGSLKGKYEDKHIEAVFDVKRQFLREGWNTIRISMPPRNRRYYPGWRNVVLNLIPIDTVFNPQRLPESSSAVFFDYLIISKKD